MASVGMNGLSTYERYLALQRDEPISYEALTTGNTSKVQDLLKKNPNLILFWRDIHGSTILHNAVYNRRIKDVRFLIEILPQSLREIDSDGEMPLHIAAMFDCYRIISVLLKKDKKIAAKENWRGLLPLHLLHGEKTDSDAVRQKAVMELIDAYPQALFATIKLEYTIDDFSLLSSGMAFIKERRPSWLVQACTTAVKLHGCIIFLLICIAKDSRIDNRKNTPIWRSFTDQFCFDQHLIELVVQFL